MAAYGVMCSGGEERCGVRDGDGVVRSLRIGGHAKEMPSLSKSRCSSYLINQKLHRIHAY
jgi:hypothetical protein